MRILIYILLMLSFLNSFSQDNQDECYRSTEGTDFWFGFMEGRNDNGNVHYIEITVTAKEATEFEIYIGKDETPYYEGFVNENGSTRITIELERGEAKGSEKIENKGIHLISKNKVNVYALNWDRNSADVAVIYPVNSLGNEYFTMCYTPNVDDDPGHGKNSEFLIVASEDETKVEITPSVLTDQGRAAGVTFEETLNKGEVYQVQSENLRNLTGQGDLTGSYIKSDKPVAVYSGNFATTIPATRDMGGYDHLFEQMPPLHTWGREYYIAPLGIRYKDTYRILAAEDNTTIEYLRGTIVLNRGEFYEFDLQNNESSRIKADKPILVAQFSRSRLTDINLVTESGDPFMIILSPINQIKNEATFVAYTSSQLEDYYINIVVLTSEINNLRLDDATIGANLFRSFGGTDYSYAKIKTYQGTHTLKCLNPNSGFLAYVYAYGGWESYGYGVGFNLDLVLDLGYEEDTIPLCNGESITLDAGPYFDNYLWSNGDTTQKITVTENGKYIVYGSTIDGCVQSDSVTILVSEPEKPNIGMDVQECFPYEQILDAGSGYAQYVWNTGETTQNILVNQTGIYSVKVYDKWGCYKSDTMSLTVFPVPTITMENDRLVCGTKSRTLNLQFEGADENMLQNGTMGWTTNQPDKLNFSNQTNQSTDIEVSDYGDYEVYYLFTTPDGCEVKDTLVLRFAQTPTSDIVFAGENPNDKCGAYHREIIYAGNATQNANYYWDFDGSLSDSLDWNRYFVSLGVQNSSPVIKLAVEEYGCWSDTSMLEIGANPDFIMNTAKSQGCDSATISFSGELKTPDNLIFEWDFGDGSPISTVQNPGHFYSDTGKFDVSLKITNLTSGCAIGYTIEEMVKIYPTPVVDIVVDPDFCNDKTVDVYYLQNKESSVCEWKFEGASQVGDGNDSITVLLEKEIANIQLRVEEFGCLSEWAQSTAKRNPVFDIVAENEDGCQPMTALLTATSNDDIVEYLWLSDSAIYRGAEQTFILPDAKNYQFMLAATSALTGCSDTTVKNDLVKVHPKPMAAFEVDYPVAILEHANLQFTNNTEDVEFFNWDFGDGFSSEEENPLHTYTQLGKFQPQLIVESEFGCKDTSSLEVNIMPFNVYTPNAFRPDSDIPENREFMPVGEGIDPNGFIFQVYNRWGDLIFESNSPDNKWDGSLNNSNLAPMGNYVWKADFYDIQGFLHNMKGQVLLIR